MRGEREERARGGEGETKDTHRSLCTSSHRLLPNRYMPLRFYHYLIAQARRQQRGTWARVRGRVRGTWARVRGRVRGTWARVISLAARAMRSGRLRESDLRSVTGALIDSLLHELMSQ